MKYSFLLHFQQAVLDEGNNPDDYHFEVSKKEPGKRTNIGSKSFHHVLYIDSGARFNHVLIVF